MKKYFLFFLCLFSSVAFSQLEANNWYFGNRAGLSFASGSPVAVTNGQLNTLEGCATLSDASGQLLCYTDGITVYNRNHTIMVNGTGLLGHPSTEQSATIVVKPGAPNLLYVFTLDREQNPEGFRYSIIDLSLDGGLGAVTAQKNVLVLTPTFECLGVTKNANGTDFWIVIHATGGNSFLAYSLTATGLSTTAITSNIGISITQIGFSGACSVKFAPSGGKMAFSSVTGYIQLFDFNNATGSISNELTVLNEFGELYGIAFSSDESVLYVTNSNGNLYQFNLNAADIPNSKNVLSTGSGFFFGQLQLGPDNKIYMAVFDKPKLAVINSPNVVGSGCNFQLQAIDLGGKMSKSGLPSFNQSFFFSPAIQLTSSCVGQSSAFSLTTNQTITNAVWDFGDATPTVTGLNPSHTYTTPNTYTVSVTATTALGTGVNTRQIVISAVPTATTPNNVLICDTNNDGFFNFDLTAQNNAILNTQLPSQYQIKYFASAADYASNTPITNPSSYPNTTAYQAQNIIAEVSNNANTSCKATTNFTIQVFESPTPAVATTILPIQVCDNTSVGTDTDGKVLFDLTQRATFILNGQLPANFTLTYYKDAALTALIPSPTGYQNTNPTETIYVKVANTLNLSCFVVTSFGISVFSLPNANAIVTLKQCDTDNDGFSAFNLNETIPLLVASPTGLTFTFFRNLPDAQSNSSAIANRTTFINQTVNNQTIFVRVTNANGCYRIATVNLIISTTNIPVTAQKSFTVCDDVASGSNTDGIATFNFSSVTPQIQALFPIGQLITIAYYKNLSDALAEINPITSPSSYTNTGYSNTQIIYIRVDSQVNNECLGIEPRITLTVERIPMVQSQTIFHHCDDDQDGVYNFDTTNLQTNLLNGLTNVTVTYTTLSGTVLPSPLPNPFTTNSQTINVNVKNNTTTACSFNASIQFVVDYLPEAFTIATSLTTKCDDEADPSNQNGSYPFDTSAFQSTLLGSQTGMIVTYYDANNNLLPSPLPNPFNTATQNVRVEISNPLNTTCKATAVIPFIVHPVPTINLFGDELVCTNNPSFTKVIDAGLINPTTSANFTYVWSFNGLPIAPPQTNYSLIVNTQGTYTVQVTNANQCSRTRTITVTASDTATINNVVVTDLSENNSLVVNVAGNGNYVYSIDGTTYQTSTIFTNVTAGVYTIYVKDLYGCGITTKEVSVLGIPNYFTPNGDGYNDFWNIGGANERLNSTTKILIFDRFGKLIKQLSPLSQGWDGTLNQQPLPSDDYWYTIQLEDNRVLKGHFALKR